MNNVTEEVAHIVADSSDGPGCETGTVGFYVTVRSGGRSGALLGPYGTHDEALANVDRARKHAEQVNDRAVWYAYGTAKVTMKPGKELKPGIFNDVIGLTTVEEGTEER